MAPIKDETVDGLRDLVSKLELRVEQLEAKLEQTTGGPASRKPRSASNGIRMILMGPPGAGMDPRMYLVSFVSTDLDSRQRNTSTQDQGKILCMSSGRSMPEVIHSMMLRLFNHSS